MKKILFILLALQFCGTTNESSFEKDFGSNTLTFTRCEHSGASEIFTSTITFNPDVSFKPYTLTFLGVETQWALDRIYPVDSAFYDIKYEDTFQVGDIEIFHLLPTGDAGMNYNGYTCYQN